jgi:molecular chaperone GrpE
MRDEKDFAEQPELSDTGARNRKSEKPDPGGAADLPADLGGAYRQLLAEKKELFDRLVRKQAELENVRKRVEREKEDFLQHATMSLIRALLPTLDGLERGLKHREGNVPQKFYEGMELIHKELLDVLKRAGLAAVESEGQIFDPRVHQAVETVESGKHRDQEVVEELQRGYKLKQRLLRPAIVKVAVTPSKNSSAPPDHSTADESPDAADE